MPSDRDCFVYVICHKAGDQFTGPVKVGISESPSSRLRELQTGNHRDLMIAAQLAVPNRSIAAHIEEGFHHTQRGHRLRGEWFNFAPGQAIVLVCLMTEIGLRLNTGFGEDEIEAVKGAIGITAALADARFHVAQWAIQ